MRNWLPVFVILTGLSVVAADSAQAQIVRVSPGGGTIVRAPFVRVQVGPWGGTYVRAPFTSVYAPGFYGPPAFFRAPPVFRPPGVVYRAPSVNRAPGVYRSAPARASQPSQAVQVKGVRDMDYRELREALRSGLTKLESQLQQRQDRAAWSRYLQPGAMRDLVAGGANEPADEITAMQLKDMLEEYDGTAADATSQSVASLSGFREVHAALAEFLRSPSERQRNQLVEDAISLSNSLSRFKTGDGWQRYLLLMDSSAAESPRTAAEWSDEEIEKLLDRFESVRGNLEFEVISRLPSFQAMHKRLDSYVRHVQSLNTQQGEAESLPPAEELPSPED